MLSAVAAISRVSLAQEHVTVESCELKGCMATRPWNKAMVIRARPASGQPLLTLDDGGDVVCSHVTSITFVQCHWPSSQQRKLSRRDRKSGISGVTALATEEGPGLVFGDLNVPLQASLEDLLVHAVPEGQWRYSGNCWSGSSQMVGPDWVLYHKLFSQSTTRRWDHTPWYSDNHYPTCFVIPAANGLGSSQAVYTLARRAIEALAGGPQPPAKRPKPLPAATHPPASSASASSGALPMTVPTPTPQSPPMLPPKSRWLDSQARVFQQCPM